MQGTVSCLAAHAKSFLLSASDDNSLAVTRVGSWQVIVFKGLVAGCHFLFIFHIFYNIHTFIQSHLYNIFIRRHSLGPLSISSSLESSVGRPSNSYSGKNFKNGTFHCSILNAAPLPPPPPPPQTRCDSRTLQALNISIVL